MNRHARFRHAINRVGQDLKNLSYQVDGKRWQSTDVSDRPELRMREIFNTSFTVALNHEDYHEYQSDIGPNLPWADDHFEERVGGRPLNPGDQWRNWPWAQSADNFRTEEEARFSHTYMERYWPKTAGIITAHGGEWNNGHGIRYALGDLADVVDHLLNDPETRQAYLPVWFPEDTGVVHKERVPCTLGYHFIQRMGYLHCTYYIRSCDFVRHFRDDLYLSLRLQLWMLNQLQSIRKTENFDWQLVKPGMFVFHCVSMHCFENDYPAICEDY